MLKFTAAAMLLCATAVSAHDASSLTGDFKGQWTVTDIVGYSDTSGGIPKAKQLLGEVLHITADSIDFDGSRCKPIKGFTLETVDTEPTLKDYYGVSLQDTGLPLKTMLLDSAQCTPVFRLDEHRVVFGWDGIILRAIRR